MAFPGIAGDRPRVHLRTSDAEIAILTATERLLAGTPLADLSVADLMREAGVARGTFYHYFSSKFAVLTSLMGRVRDELLTSFEDDLDQAAVQAPADALRTSLERVIEQWTSHRAVLRAVSEHWRAVPELHDIWLSMFDRFATAVAARLDAQAAAGTIPAGRNHRELAAALVYGSERCLYVAGLGVDDDFPDESAMADYVIEMWVGGLYGSHAAPGRSRSLDLPADLRAWAAADPASSDADVEAAILLAGERLLETTPLSELSVRQIYDEARIGRTTFYRHYASKLDVVTRLVESTLSDAYDAFDRTEPERDGPLDRTLERRLQAMSIVWARHRAVLRAAMEGWPQVPELATIWLGIIDRYGDAVAAMIDRERAAGHAPPGLDSRRLAKALAWMTESCMLISGLGVDPYLPDEDRSARTATAVSLGAIYH